MHLVFVSSLVPDGQLGSGYEIANSAIAASLRRHGVQLSFLGFAWPGREPSEPANTQLLGHMDVRTDSASAWQKSEWLATAMANRLTFASAKMRAVSAGEVRRALAAFEPFDGFVLNSFQLAGAFEGIFAEKPSIYVAHNVEHLSAAGNARSAQGSFQRLLFAREARLLKALESRLCGRARFVFTLAEDDRAALGVDKPGRSVALPLITREALVRPRRQIAHDAGLIGSWTWQPNRVGLEWFVSKVAPLLPPDYSVRVAGSLPSGFIIDAPNVQAIGRVADATEFVMASGVIPLVSTEGTGVQLKTIETFELGLPSVATTRSVRGLGMIPANCTVTDDPAAFAAALVRAARSNAPLADGRAFHAAQREALDNGVGLGLAAFAAKAARVAA